MTDSLKSVFFTCQEAARVMIPQGGGKIVNTGSNFGVVGFKTRAVYTAAKAGTHRLSRALSLEDPSATSDELTVRNRAGGILANHNSRARAAKSSARATSTAPI